MYELVVRLGKHRHRLFFQSEAERLAYIGDMETIGNVRMIDTGLVL